MKVCGSNERYWVLLWDQKSQDFIGVKLLTVYKYCSGSASNLNGGIELSLICYYFVCLLAEIMSVGSEAGTFDNKKYLDCTKMLHKMQMRAYFYVGITE